METTTEIVASPAPAPEPTDEFKALPAAAKAGRMGWLVKAIRTGEYKSWDKKTRLLAVQTLIRAEAQAQAQVARCQALFDGDRFVARTGNVRKLSLDANAFMKPLKSERHLNRMAGKRLAAGEAMERAAGVRRALFSGTAQ